MPYAKLVFGLAVDGPFDYSVPAHLAKIVAAGKRARVNFNHKSCVGYIVQLARTSNIPRLKPILEVIDDSPVLTQQLLLLTREVSEYYCCSWGEAIDTALPSALRKGKSLMPPKENPPAAAPLDLQAHPFTLVLQDISRKARWDAYGRHILAQVAQARSVIVIVPDVEYALAAKEMLAKEFNIDASLLYRGQKQEAALWHSLKHASCGVVLGTRAAVFAPLNNLGLIILDEESDSVYKQEQVPHYHARQVALMRQKIEGASLILGGSFPSLESFQLASAKPAIAEPKVEYLFGDKDVPLAQVQLAFSPELFSKKAGPPKILTRLMEDAITSALSEHKEKILIFVNRKGFATLAYCAACGASVQCPRCEMSLVYYFDARKLRCNHCNFSMEKPVICPACNKGYIKFSGTGDQKVESELSRLFPQARIKAIKARERVEITDADIFISTSAVLHKPLRFDLVGVLSLDNALNRMDFRAAEKTFALLMGLRGLAKKTLIIQTMLTRHHIFEALQKNNLRLFYEKELALRKELKYPPYWHFAAVRFRGHISQKVKAAAESAFDMFKGANTGKGLQVEPAIPGTFPKLRGNYFYQIHLKARSIKKITDFLKLHLKKIRHSGIIITVDVDPF